MIKRLSLYAILLLGGILSMQGASLNEARRLIKQGNYTAAIEALNELSAAEPRNNTVALLLGDCYRLTHRQADASAQYRAAIDRGEPDGYLGLVEIAVSQYDLSKADELLDTYRDALTPPKKKGKKQKAQPSHPDNSDAVSSRLERTRNMLNRVQKIVVIDSINVPANEFFSHYRLSPESGTLLSTTTLPGRFSAANPSVVYRPQSGNEMMWAAPDSTGHTALVSSAALYGNNWDRPVAVGAHLGDGGDANFPFLMPDGITLYYANNGENSLGGYDIFITRRDGNDFLQPQNLGMPYNSPDNDYMMAIDETTGVGWWATDRNHIDGMVTIYMFIPSEMRVNVDVNSPHLAALARLSSIALTHERGADYSDIVKRVASISRSTGKQQAHFHFPLPDGRVITRVDQLKDSDARLAMKRYLDIKNTIDSDSNRLAALRLKYADGDQSVADEILELERTALSDMVTLRHAANDVIASECK